MITENLIEVQENIRRACEKAGRSPSEVTLIAVSKTKPNEDVMEAYKAGIRDFGENYVQELVGKIDSLPNDIHWHMIGHLQRNKVKYLTDRADHIELIHSVDSLRLAEEISKRGERQGIKIPILVEVNIAEEENKFGLSEEETKDLVKNIAKLPGITVKGLMTSAPFVTNPEENRDYFRRIKSLSVDIEEENIDNVSMRILSMGMTADYTVAVEEGATMVRVGTAIFGARNYNK